LSCCPLQSGQNEIIIESVPAPNSKVSCYRISNLPLGIYIYIYTHVQCIELINL
jgi:hypothetical protein